jgi:maltooligosyltrehalose synthase
MLEGWRDGRVKLFTTTRTLAVRKRHIDAFRGAYRAVTSGTTNAVAFTRGDDGVLIVVPRLTTQLAGAPRLPLGDVWAGHALEIGGRWRNEFTGAVIEAERLALRDVFAAFPVAVLTRA